MLKHQNKHMEYKDKDHIQFWSQKKPTVHEREVMHVCVCVCVCVCVYIPKIIYQAGCGQGLTQVPVVWAVMFPVSG